MVVVTDTEKVKVERREMASERIEDDGAGVRGEEDGDAGDWIS